MTRYLAHHSRSSPAGALRGKLITRIWKLLASRETRQVKIELDILRHDPVEAPFNQRRKAHTLIDDNPCSG
jgi:hypothetical protein